MSTDAPRHASTTVAEESGASGIHQVMASVTGGSTNAAAALAFMQIACVAIVPARVRIDNAGLHIVRSAA